MEGSIYSNLLYNTPSKGGPYVCLNASSDERLTASEEALPPSISALATTMPVFRQGQSSSPSSFPARN